MFFSTLDETILREHDESGSPVYRYVMGQEKVHMARKLNGQINNDIAQDTRYLKHANSEVNTVEEALHRGAMYCNFLKTKKYQNVLFVGHFNAQQPSWLLEGESARMVDLMTPERSHLNAVADPNIVLQFVPMVHKMYGYTGEVSVVQPYSHRNRGVMHSLYGKNGLSENKFHCNTQYRHGMTADEWHLTLPEGTAKFDAVVFLGVPKKDDLEGFSEAVVRGCFSPICTADFAVIDMYYNEGDVNKFGGSKRQSNVESLSAVFSNRGQWDDAVQQDGGRPEEYAMMDRIISVF